MADLVAEVHSAESSVGSSSQAHLAVPQRLILHNKLVGPLAGTCPAHERISRPSEIVQRLLEKHRALTCVAQCWNVACIRAAEADNRAEPLELNISCQLLLHHTQED